MPTSNLLNNTRGQALHAYELERPEHLRDWLQNRYKVLQPVHDQTGNGSWEEVHAGDVVPFDPALRPVMSPKSLFFAEREQMFTFDGEMFRTTTPKTEHQVLFGVKACDLMAISYQDHHFRDDPYYQARRKDTLLVGIDCSSPCENGFCSTVDAGPQVHQQNADLILTPMPSINGHSHGWWLICTSDHGAQAINGMDLPPADSHWRYWRDMSNEHALADFADDTYIINGIQRINARAVPDEVWDTLGHQCLSCSGCSQTCPTCSCYAVRDIPKDGGFVRERFHDSCLMVGFQKEASGANPTAQAGRRVARYWYHKFSSDFKAANGRIGCVGCGRCDITCPGAIGVHSVMEKIAHA
ncbi:4Fe-4S dicluster domain-containing protein [Parendozoicomonas haliclonae]|uniref:Anaerobic sulfite reductase subunit A n=1 Tax=Parendozoicomonas haliclonae TaxID=1960125 RepID=A0A1X7AQJ2_9GAMM|nr:4Fe-4S dicluster domain-containing protein [Parendozoicomonas haliclonae]SMA50566.1 Anaerobic sulfite reductase subunit A [Parendozoicomonas haliclonae]